MNTKTLEQLQAELEQARAENAKLKAEKGKNPWTYTGMSSTGRQYTLSCKIGDKGGIVINGLTRFGLNVFREGAEVLFSDGGVDMVRRFIQDNANKLSVKERKVG